MNVMKKINILLCGLVISPFLSLAQIGIGTNNPHASSLLDLESTEKGFLPPRVANTSSITDPAEGLMVYDESDNCLNVYNNSEWVNLCSTGSGGSSGGGSGSSGSIITTCDGAGLTNPKQLEPASFSGFQTAMAISSNDELWVFGKDHVNISNRSFQFPTGYSGNDNTTGIVLITTKGNAHKISTPRNNTLVPSKIIAAYTEGNVEWVTNDLPCNIQYLVEFTNGEQWWYLQPVNGTTLPLINNQVITSSAPFTNLPLLCGDDLPCVNLSDNQLGGTTVPVSERAEKYSWVRLVPPSGTKVVNVIGSSSLSNQHGIFMLLDDGRVVHRHSQNNWYTNIANHVPGHKVEQIGVVLGSGSGSVKHTLYLLYSNGELYSIVYDDFNGTPQLRDSQVREMSTHFSNIDGVVYTKQDKQLYVFHRNHRFNSIQVGNFSDVEYLTTPKTYVGLREHVHYYSTNNEVKMLSTNGGLGGTGGNFPNAQFSVPAVFTPNLNLEPVNLATLNMANFSIAANAAEQPNIAYTTGVKRVYLMNGTLAGIHTNEVLAVRQHPTIPENAHLAGVNGKFAPFSFCNDVQVPFKLTEPGYDYSSLSLGQ